MKKSIVKECSPFHSITTQDLREDSIVLLENGLLLKFVGNVDTRNNNTFLFKTIYSPFATSVWIEMTREKVATLKVFIIK